MNTALATPDFAPTRNEILADKISELAAHIHAATYRFLVMVREFDEREAWAEMGSSSCAHWLNWRCGISVHTGREKVRVAHALAALDHISAAFERGELSYSKVRAVTRVATKDNEDVFLNIALHGTAAQLEQLVRCEVRVRKESEIVANTKAAYEQRYFSWHKENDGSVTFHGRLPAELAAKVIGAIESYQPEDQPEDYPEHELETDRNTTGETPGIVSGDTDKNVSAETPPTVINDINTRVTSVGINYSTRRAASVNTSSGSPENLSHKSFEKLSPCITGTGTGTDTETRVATGGTCCTGSENLLFSPAEKPSLGARRADALVALAENGCTGYEIRLHVPAGTSAHANSLESGGTIPYAAAKRICCDAAIVPVIEGAAGELLDIGRRSRKIPPPMRRALEVRDKSTCRFPGCTHTRYLHGHHIKHWADDGKTCLDNLVLLCSHHHGLVHEGGFGCTALRRSGSKGVSIVFRRPDGVIIPEAFRLASVIESIESRQKQLNINADTCTARDAGSPLDVNVVLDALEFRRRHRK